MKSWVELLVFLVCLSKTFGAPCLVSDWIIGDCSVSCGNGTRIDTRKILSLPTDGGTPCPDLSRTMGCSQPTCGNVPVCDGVDLYETLLRYVLMSVNMLIL